VTDTLYNAYTTLPAMVLFAKLVPEKVESSMFALLTGVINFSNLFASRELGVLINKFFFQVTYSEDANNLNEVWKLYCVQAGMCVLPMLFLTLLPTKAQVQVV
jgi:hypothetical protein